MFVDMTMSKQVMDEYRKTDTCTTSEIDVDINMLTMGYWPLKDSAPCTLPRSLQNVCQNFTDFYAVKHSGRKLKWMHTYGSVDVKASNKKSNKDYLLIVSLYQMAILMRFNENPTQSLTSIRESTGIESELELRRHLLSLATPKLRVLTKSSKGRGMEENEVFTINDDFSSKFKRIKVPLISAKEVQLPQGMQVNKTQIQRNYIM
jgi:cullin 3